MSELQRPKPPTLMLSRNLTRNASTRVPRVPFLALASSLAFLPLVGVSATREADLPPGTYRLQSARIVDAQGFGQPMTAATIFIPAGWTTSGGYLWQINNTGCGKNGSRFEWRATSPDGSQSIEIIPEETWTGHNLPMPPMQQSCPNVTITNAKDYLQWYVQRNRPGARILDYRARPEYVESMQAMNRSDTSVGGELRSWVEGGEVLVGYTADGRDMRETIGIPLLFMLNRMQGVYPGEIREFLTISAMPGFAVRAPHGQLDFKLSETIRRSIKTDPTWSARMAEHNNKMGQIAAKGAADRHAIRMDTIRQVGEMNTRAYNDRMAASDRSHEQFVQSIRGVQTYSDPSANERIELPNTHDNVWRLNDGTFILTDDANFAPGRDLGQDGRRLEVAR